MSTTPAAVILRSLDVIASEIVTILDVLDSAPNLPPDDRREAKRRVMEMRGRAQEVFRVGE